MNIVVNLTAHAGILLALLLQDSSLTADKKKFPVPPAKIQALGYRTIKKRYPEEYKAKGRDSKLAFAAKLIEASKSEKDQGIKFALLALAQKIGREEADTKLVFQAVDGIFGTFDIHPIEMKTQGLLKTYKSVKDEDSAKELVEASFAVIDECIGTLQSGPVKSLEKLAKKAAKKTKDRPYEKQVVERIAEARKRYIESETLYREFQKKLLSWADSKKGEQVGGGECTDYVNAALGAAHADLDFPYYVFGRRLFPGEMPLSGDVLAFIYTDEGGTARNHVVLIKRVFSPLNFAVLHQNVDGVRSVVEGVYDLKSFSYDLKSFSYDYYLLYRPVRAD